MYGPTTARWPERNQKHHHPETAAPAQAGRPPNPTDHATDCQSEKRSHAMFCYCFFSHSTWQANRQHGICACFAVAVAPSERAMLQRGGFPAAIHFRTSEAERFCSIVTRHGGIPPAEESGSICAQGYPARSPYRIHERLGNLLGRSVSFQRDGFQCEDTIAR